MGAYTPPDWPDAVRPPGSRDFEASAVEWLLDVLPPEFRGYGELRRHPIALAMMARHYAVGCVEGARAGYRGARRELAGDVPPHAIEELLRAYRAEGFRLAPTSRGVVLVGQALRGQDFRPQLLACPPRQARGHGHRPASHSRAGAGPCPRPPPGSRAEMAGAGRCAANGRPGALAGEGLAGP